MALPILDGNQTAATLSTIITGGAHIPAHTVVSLGSQAISDITSGVSGSVVSISNFPSTQTVAGTVTANVAGNLNGTIENYNTDGTATHKVAVQIYDPNGQALGGGAPLPISGTVTASLAPQAKGPVYEADSSIPADPKYMAIIGGFDPIGGETRALQLGSNGGVIVQQLPAISGTVTIGSLPAISGTVTVGNNNFNIKTVIAQDGSANFTAFNGTQFRLYTPTGASKTLNNIFGPTPSWVVAFTDSVTWTSDSGTQASYFHDGTQWTLDDFTTPAGTLALDGSVFITNLSTESNINILNGFTAAQLGAAYINGSGALRVSIYSSTVTAAAPNGSLTTRFGTPTTANVSFATSAVTNANRKYLLIQNLTTGSNVITVGIGFTPTTTQGIQLTAGAGITFESSYIPTGQIFVLSSVTASNFTILEA